MACITEDLNPPVPILGCTDPTANNYNPETNQDDGSCIFTPAEVSGCTDPTAINYNPSATIQPEDCECIYEECPDSETIIIIDGTVYYQKPGIIDGEENEAEEGDATTSRTQRDVIVPEITIGGGLVNVPLTNELCCDELGPEYEFVDGFCKLVETPACPDNLTVIEGVLFDGDSGTPVDENCCNNVEGFTYSTNFQNPDGTLGACLKDPEFVEEDCILSINDVIYVGDTVVFDSSQITTGEETPSTRPGNTGGSTGGSTGGDTGGSTGGSTGDDTGGGTQGGVPNEGSSENCFTIDYWYFRPITSNTSLQNPDPNSNNEPFLPDTILLTFGISELPRWIRNR